jgi:hypothetical protein
VPRLDKDYLLRLYRAFDVDRAGYGKWRGSFLQALRWAQGLTKTTARDPEVQNKLWKMAGITPLGYAERIDVSRALADERFVERLVEVAFAPADPLPSRRAAEVQAGFDDLLDRLRPHVDKMPRSRLFRCLHALRPADFCTAMSDESLASAREFLVGDAVGAAAVHVHARARLREVLGTEADLDEHVKRSMFIWWLHEYREAVAQHRVPDLEPAPEADIVELPRLELWPESRRIRWIAPLPGGLETLRIVVREALEGTEPGLVAGSLRDPDGERPWSDRQATAALHDLRRLGLLREEGGVWTATSEGARALDAAGLPGLQENVASRVENFAVDLRDLARLEPADRAAAAQRAQNLQWALDLGLCRRLGSSLLRTEAGEALVSRLSPDLPARSYLFDASTPSPASAAAEREPALSDLLAGFRALQSRGMRFTDDQVLALHAAWRFGARLADGRPPKRFVILSGLSGTGKTQILLHYARLVCAGLGLDPQAHVALVPVRPDWRDPTGLFGYLNALHAEPTFRPEPALRLMIRAARDPEHPYFLILDEMNLARVEQYLAPLLSAMESGEDLDLHPHDAPLGDVPPRLRWPSNLRIGGTVNMDESTFAFSDKVLDRALTMEFWSVDLRSFMEARPGREAADADTEQALLAFQEHLEPIRRHIGYRAAGEALAFAAEARAAGMDATRATDLALLAKVLPRLRGHETAALTDRLARLNEVAKLHGLASCAAKLEEMAKRLRDAGVTGFWS